MPGFTICWEISAWRHVSNLEQDEQQIAAIRAIVVVAVQGRYYYL